MLSCPHNTRISFMVSEMKDDGNARNSRQMMEWRNDQARRDKEAKGLASQGKHDPKQAINVSKQPSQESNLRKLEPCVHRWGGRISNTLGLFSRERGR